MQLHRLVLLVVVACAARSVPPQPPPTAPPTNPTVPELVSYLASPDPLRRDQLAYTELDRRIANQLTDDELRELRDQLLANLAKPITVPESVFERSFSVLVLASIVGRDVAKPFLRDDERRSLLAAARDYASRESDLRGHTGAQGWAHAAAHTADLLAQLANEPGFTDDDRGIVLDAVGQLVVRRHGQILHYGEDGRLAVAVLAAARRGLAKPKLEAWIHTLVAPLGERSGEAFDARLYAAQRNARNLLFALFVQASLAAPMTVGDQQLLDAVRAALVS